MKTFLTSTLAVGAVLAVGASQPASAIVTQPIPSTGHQDSLILARDHGHGHGHGSHHRHGRDHHRHHHRHHHNWGWGGGYWGSPVYNNWGYTPSCGWVYGKWTCW